MLQGESNRIPETKTKGNGYHHYQGYPCRFCEILRKVTFRTFHDFETLQTARRQHYTLNNVQDSPRRLNPFLLRRRIGQMKETNSKLNLKANRVELLLTNMSES